MGPTLKKFTVHKDILSRSPVFARMCKGPFRTSDKLEIDLPDDTKTAFEGLVEYVYTDIYHHLHPLDRAAKFKSLARIYTIAKKYQLHVLKNLLIEQFHKLLSDATNLGIFLVISRQIYDSAPEPLLLLFLKFPVLRLLALV